MNLKKENILFFTRTMQLGGTENVILQMCEILKPYVNKIIVCSCGGVNLTQLDQMGIKHYEIPDIDSKSPKILIDVFCKVKSIIKNENITIVHTHHRMATFYMHFLKKVCNVKLLSTLHGSFTDKKTLTRMVYKNINIIACGYIVKDYFVKNYNIDEKNVTVISNAIKKVSSNNKVIDEKKYNMKKNKKIAYIGRLSKEKGVDLLIESFAILLEKNKNLSLIIVGSGDLDSKLKSQVKELHIENNVIFLGYQENIQDIIQQIDLVVLPSYTEGLPLTPIESFAYGKPVVATAAGGTVEIIEDNKNGFLVPIGDVKALTEKIQEVIENESLYKKMCLEAENTYKEKYTFNVFKNKILDYYEQISEERK